MELGRIAKARGFRLVVHEEIDSTNEEAKRLIAAGERGPLWIVARRQSQGRGRLGRNWESPPGNLYATLVLSDAAPARRAPELGFVTGLATIEALKAATGFAERLTLKWPNDILLDGAKLAGVLLEAAVAPVAGETESSAIIGIGVNCISAPLQTSYPAIALADRGPTAPSAPALFSLLSDAMIASLDLWDGGERFHAIRAQWLKQAGGIGETIKVKLAREIIEGRFETIDAAGRLKIMTDLGERIVEAGDVFFPSADTSAERGA